MDSIQCEACSHAMNPDQVVYYRTATFNALRCVNCHLVFVDRMVPVEDEPDNADEFWFNKVKENSKLLTAKKRRFAMQLQFAEEKGQLSRGRLLDVGCGCGWLLEVASGRDWDAHGIDTSAQFLEMASQIVEPQRLSLGTIETATLPEGSVDLVTAIGVLEHVDKPKEFICHISRILRPGGCLLLETPTAEALFHAMNHVAICLSRGRLVRPSLSPGGHRYLFNAKALKALVSKQGLDVVASKQLVSPYHEITSKFGRAREFGAKFFGRVVLPGLWVSAWLLGMGNQLMVLACKKRALRGEEESLN